MARMSVTARARIEREAIILKYLQIAKDGVAALIEAYHQAQQGKSQQEAYKLVAKHHEKVKKLVKKVSDNGFAELEQRQKTGQRFD